MNKVHPDESQKDERTEMNSKDSLKMDIFEKSFALGADKSAKAPRSAAKNERISNILLAIEKWNLKKIMTIKNSFRFGPDHLFQYSIPASLKSKLVPNFWDSLVECNFLHYAALHRATRIVSAFLKSFNFEVNRATQEGVTALHISAALGDFFTARELICNGANVEALDEKGRLALHYAVQTNIEMCMILTRDTNFDVNLDDKDEVSILEYAKVADKPNILEYIENVKEKITSYWIPQHLFQFECDFISPRKEDESLCECGRNVDNHKSLFDKYDIGENDFVEKPTNYYGEIEFSRLYRSRPYVRVSKNTPFEFMAKLLIEHWQIERPSLIISIYGSDFEGHSIKDILKKGIWKSAGNQGTNVWIITNGVATNLIQVVGEAVRDFTEAYGEDQIYGIALFPWNFHQKTDFFHSDNYMGNHPVEYQQTITKDSDKQSLDQNHSHYIFLDIPKIMNQTKFYTEYRLEFESAVTNFGDFITKTNASNENAPICGILVSGTRDDLKIFYGSLVKNGKPSVVIKGSGGLANLIGEILDELNSKQRKRKTMEEILEREKLRVMMIELWNVVDDFEEEINMLKDIIDNRHLIEIFSVEDDLPNELDKKILSSLLSQDKSSIKNRDSLNIYQLNIALSINRFDVAKEKIFTEGKKWKSEDLNPLVSKSISENKVGFVKLFVEKGFSLGKIITVDFIEQLYAQDIYSASKPARILSQGLRAIKFKKSSNKVSLYDIGRVLRHLLGDLYNPLYLRASFEEAIISKTPLERPIRELFIWSLLTQRMELAQFIWTLETEAIAAALFAANLLRSMLTLTDVVSYKEELLSWATNFEEKAEGVVDECYKERPDNTRENLVRILEFYGNSTYLELAADGNSIKFIAHRSCQELLDVVWRHALDDTTKSLEFVMYLVIGITFPFILPFIVHYKPFYYPSEDNSTVNKKKQKDSRRKSVMNFKKEDKSMDSKAALLKSVKLVNFRLKIYFRKLFDFYSTPVIKFSYTIFFYMVFLFYFTFLNLTGYHVKTLNMGYKWIYILLCIWTISLSIEEVRQAFGSGISFKAYISDIWNRIDIFSYLFFTFGTFGIILTFCDPLVTSFTFSLLDLQPMNASSTSLLKFSKFSYGFSIFLLTIRILQYFTINVHMGPIIVMIENMLSNDLGPFMVILMTFLVSYGILLWSINFEVKQDLAVEEIPRILYQMLRTAYFQLYGDLRIDILRGENNLSDCTLNNLMCPDTWGVWIGPIITAIYMVLSNVLMLNVLIAIFSNTYEIIQSSATQYWTLQRYHLMRQSSNRPPVAPPFIIIWQLIYIISKIFSFSIEERNPFKISYTNLPTKEKQLIQWEHMRAIDYMRSFDETYRKNKSSTTLVVNRGNTSVGSIGNVKKDLDILRNEIIENFKERMTNVESRLQKLEIVDENVLTVIDMLQQLKSKPCNCQNNQRTEYLSRTEYTTETPIGSAMAYHSKTVGVESSASSTKLWYINVQNHEIFRLVPMINRNTDIKKTFINEETVPPSVVEYLNKEPANEMGVPVNPYKVLNKIGKSFLPLWGSNDCIHIMISRWKRDDKDNILKLNGKPILQVIAICQNNRKEIPFVFVHHNASCLLNSCSSELLKTIIKDYINYLFKDDFNSNLSVLENNIKVLNNSTINEIYRGYVNDFRNTDNSWMETVAFNIQQVYSLAFSNIFIEKLAHHKSEKAGWVDVLRSEWTNPSCIELLGFLADYHDAEF